jgi:hypothetical protein
MVCESFGKEGLVQNGREHRSGRQWWMDWEGNNVL